ncbi:MAG TPA: AEC family transporter, partial [Verrucomicrobiae bacterium]|nr:AEC family transporter [Verrucomicrobiae bacterium]
RGFLTDAVTATLSVLVVDVAFPALVFTQMLRTVDADALRREWFAPLLCGMLIIIAYFVGLLLAPLFSSKSQRNTFLFLVAIPNWIFLPLPIVQALYGDSGIRTVLLCNVGAQIVLWSFGVWILHGAMRQAVKNLYTNVGLWATAVGVIVALLFPAARNLETLSPAAASPALLVPGAIVQALAMVGSLTIPMSLLAIGAQLGELTIAVHRFPKILWGVLLSRLVVAPLVTVALGIGLMHLGARVPGETRMIIFLIATMPVAISCSVMTERFSGDTTLAAESIFYSTFFSLLTVPAIFVLIQRFG